MTAARVTARGAERWVRGHPWIYRSDVRDAARRTPAWCRCRTRAAGSSARRLLSPASEIRLRLLERSDRPVDAAWWRERLEAAAARRAGIDATAYRVVHGEGDGLPSLVVDRYDRWLVVQLLSAGLETMREPILDALVALLPARGHPAAPRCAGPAARGAPTEIGAGLRRRCRGRSRSAKARCATSRRPGTGQKTGAFLDQRPNRLLAGEITRPGGRALDCFAYHGSFALHLARARGERDRPRLERRRAGARRRERRAQRARQHRVARGGRLRGAARHGPRTRAVRHHRARPAGLRQDPRAPCRTALRGYREINLRAMRCLAPGGTLLTASCSFHVRLPGVSHHARRGRRRQRPAHPDAPRARARARTIPRCSPSRRPATSRARCCEAD